MSKPEHLPALRRISLDRIQIGTAQPRRCFARDEINRLAASIRSVGIIHPPVVQQDGENSYTLIAGERRVRAARQAGLTHISVLVRPSSKNFGLQAALIENIQRVDLNPLEVARAVKRLIDELGMTQRQLATALGKKRSTITNYLRLLNLPIEIQDKLSDGSLSLGHAKALLAVTDPSKKTRLLQRILREKLSVRQSEKLANAEDNKQTPVENSQLFLSDLENQLQEHLGTRVQIQGKDNHGKITLHYHNLDELDHLLSLLGLLSN